MKYPHLEKHLPLNFGFGTGYEFKESSLTISNKNTSYIKQGNTFCIITYLKDLERKDKSIYSMQLTDTIIVQGSKNLILTQENLSDYGNIAYDMSGEG